MDIVLKYLTISNSILGKMAFGYTWNPPIARYYMYLSEFFIAPSSLP